MKSLTTEGRHRSLLFVALLAPLLSVTLSSSAEADSGTTMQVVFTEDCYRGANAVVTNTSPNKIGVVTAQITNKTDITDYQLKPGMAVQISTGLNFDTSVSVQTIDDMKSPTPVVTDWGAYAFSGKTVGCPPMLADARVKKWGKRLNHRRSKPQFTYKTTAWRTDVGYRRAGTKRIQWSGYALQAGRYRMVLPVVKPGHRVKYEIFSRNGDADQRFTEPVLIGSKRFKRPR